MSRIYRIYVALVHLHHKIYLLIQQHEALMFCCGAAPPADHRRRVTVSLRPRDSTAPLELLSIKSSHSHSFPSRPLQESEKIIAELNETWEEKLRKTEAIRMERWVSSAGRVFFFSCLCRSRSRDLASQPSFAPRFSLPGVLSVCDNPPEALSVPPHPHPFFLTPPALSCLTYFTCPSHFPCSHSVSFRYSLRRRRSAEH